MKIHVDFETRSAADLRKVGAWAYAMHPTTEVVCATWANDAGEKVTLGLGDAMDKRKVPAWVHDSGSVTGAHNAGFEYAVYECVLRRRMGWPDRRNPKLWSCTMARAAMVGLPLDLESLARVLNLKTQKDLNGRRVMLRLSKPDHFDALGEPVWCEDAEDLKTLYAYNAVDVDVEIEADKLLPQMPPEERAVWELDLVANSRGVAVDLDLCRKASSLAGVLTTDLNGRLRALTGGAVDKATQTTALKVWVASQGVAVPTKEEKDGTEKETLDKTAILGLLADPSVPQKVRDVICIRQQVGKSSTAKYAKALETAGPDGRVRGVLQYHAAHTGRWGGRLIQPQNYTKGFETELEQWIALELLDDPAKFSSTYGERSMTALSDLLRGSIVAGPGKVLVAADYNAIEARVWAWLACEETVLASYRRGDSPYVDLARAIYSNDAITKKIHPKEYDLGKRAFLGFGYGMGAAKFKLTCKVQAGIDIDDEFAERAKSVFREKYSRLVRLWHTMEAAAINAVKSPGSIHGVCENRIVWGMSKDRRFLKCRLPSGRFLWYWKPSVRGLWMTYCRASECPHMKAASGVPDVMLCPEKQQKETLCYAGEDPKTHQWGLLKTYGGALVENVTQAVARDVMAGGMLRCEAAGYPIVLTVHDEIMAEIPDFAPGFESKPLLDSFIYAMCDLPPWAAGLPVAAEGWIGTRYRK